MRIVRVQERKKLVAVMFVLLVGGCGHRAQQKSTRTAVQSLREAKITKVYLNAKGNQRLVHRFRTYLDFELDDVGIRLAKTAAEADSVIGVELNVVTKKTNLGLGVIRMEVSAGGKREQIYSCAMTSTNEVDELYERSVDVAPEKIREKYPNARTVRLDPASEMYESKSFGEELQKVMKASGFDLVNSGSADIDLRVDLLRQKVAIEEDVVNYEIKASSKDGSSMFSTRSSGVISAKLADRAPEACPDRFVDFDWMTANDSLHQEARGIARNFRKRIEKSAASADKDSLSRH